MNQGMRRLAVAVGLISGIVLALDPDLIGFKDDEVLPRILAALVGLTCGWAVVSLAAWVIQGFTRRS